MASRGESKPGADLITKTGRRHLLNDDDDDDDYGALYDNDGVINSIPPNDRFRSRGGGRLYKKEKTEQKKKHALKEVERGLNESI